MKPNRSHVQGPLALEACAHPFTLSSTWAMPRWVAVAAMTLGVVAASGGVEAQTPPVVAGCTIFPQSAIFNQRIDDPARFPVHASSAKWIKSVGAARQLHADWGTSEDANQPGSYYGIPYNVIDGSPATTAWPVQAYEIVDPRDGNGAGVPAESDCAVLTNGTMSMRRGCSTVPVTERRFPYPLDAVIKAEHGHCNDPETCGDRHVLVLERGATCRLWESYFAYQVAGQWKSYSTAAWDLGSLAMRPKGWTSADAGGLPILPLLARIDEADVGEIHHALRVTFRDGVLDNKFVWPAGHTAGNAVNHGIPLGAVMRLKADFQPPFYWAAQARTLARAMQQHGVYVADLGSDFFIQGEPSVRWSSVAIKQIQGLKMSDFEFVDLHAITSDPRFKPDSFQAAW
ncbi:MAG: hypothetical protein AB3X37_08405 [Leptothrix ochracea]|uniref:hypothetical protein n=1 Tax=Leptothrix ochracea TaxID=735331 RepID=UPI0034E25521